ncbi:MAG: cupin domain-containing protein [Planctomycetaceae bacterium]
MIHNLFDNLPESLPEELVEVLAENRQVRIERITTTGQHSPPDFWYDQAEYEWVVLLRGRAEIAFQDGSRKLLQPGDYLLIPPHQRHRVHWTEPNETCLWLAIFYACDQAPD